MIEATTLYVIFVKNSKQTNKIFSWVQLIHENITQQINFMTKLSQTNISQTMVLTKSTANSTCYIASCMIISIQLSTSPGNAEPLAFKTIHMVTNI